MKIKAFYILFLFQFPAIFSANCEAVMNKNGFDRINVYNLAKLNIEAKNLRLKSAFETTIDNSFEDNLSEKPKERSNKFFQYQYPSNLTLSQFNALVDLYDSTSINLDWTVSTGWDQAVRDSVVDVSGWYGITVNPEGKLYELNLDNNNLNGFLPSTLGNLTEISGLIIANNSLLTGKVPSSLINLTKMVYLNLSYNNLSGAIPNYMSNFPNLATLLLIGNEFTGGIPSDIGSITSLELLYLALNGIRPINPYFRIQSQWLNLCDEKTR